jgi:membrane associated rhomboid family serine protease
VAFLFDSLNERYSSLESRLEFMPTCEICGHEIPDDAMYEWQCPKCSTHEPPVLVRPQTANATALTDPFGDEFVKAEYEEAKRAITTPWDRYPVTIVLIAINIIFFAVVGMTDKPWTTPFAAGSGVRTLDGEWWRLMTSNFVHIYFFHLLGNIFFIWLYGKRIEKILGKWTFLAFFLLCGLSASVVDLTLSPEEISYGASLCVFGLAGALIST